MDNDPLTLRVTFFVGLLTPEDVADIGCPETSVSNCHYSPCNSPEVRSFDLLSGGSL